MQYIPIWFILYFTETLGDRCLVQKGQWSRGECAGQVGGLGGAAYMGRIKLQLRAEDLPDEEQGEPSCRYTHYKRAQGPIRDGVGHLRDRLICPKTSCFLTACLMCDIPGSIGGPSVESFH